MHGCLVAACFASGCYMAHEPAETTDCLERPPDCASRLSACGPARAESAECRDGSWACPAGSSPSTPWREASCLPLFGALDPAVDGFPEAPVPIEIDGACVWLLSMPADGSAVQLAARPGPTCGSATLASRDSVVDVPDASTFIGVQAAFEDARGQTRALVRGWRFDPAAAFGVRALGVGLARVGGGRVSVDDRWLFDPDLDLGDAALVFEDHLYAYGCPGEPAWIEEDCIVGRAPLAQIDDRAAWELRVDRGWGEGEPARVFGSGPHRGPVVVDPRTRGLLHVYAVGFGTAIEITRAARPEGPWSPATALVNCELPADDPDAYCAGPVVHLELWDPFAPDFLVVGYGVGTLAPDAEARRARNPDVYWPRLVRVPF